MTKTDGKKRGAPKTPFSFRKHILPPVVGVLVMITVLGLLNGEYLLARWRYQSHGRNTVAAAPLQVQDTPEAPAPKPDPSAPSTLSIPVIDVTAPIVFEPTTTEWKIQVALRSGVVHYANTGTPGQPGNV